MLIFRESVLGNFQSFQNINFAKILIERYMHGTPEVGLYYVAIKNYIVNTNPFSNFRNIRVRIDKFLVLFL